MPSAASKDVTPFIPLHIAILSNSVPHATASPSANTTAKGSFIAFEFGLGTSVAKRQADGSHVYCETKQVTVYIFCSVMYNVLFQITLTPDL